MSSKKRKHRHENTNTTEIDYDAIIDDIVSCQNDTCVLEKASDYASPEKLYDIFINRNSAPIKGLPTKEYKIFLSQVVLRLNTFTHDQLNRIQLFFFSWDANHALTGIFKLPVDPSDPNYLDTDPQTYEVFHNLMHSVLPSIIKGRIMFEDEHHTIDLANSSITLTIQMWLKGCPFGNKCYRMKTNPLHLQYMHPRASAQGGRKRTTSNRKQKKRKTIKRTQSNTHKI